MSNINITLEQMISKANQGDSDSQFKLGYSYFYGKNVSEDHTKAAYYFLKASEHNHCTAQYYLARMFLDGDGVQKDTNKAITILKKISKIDYLSDFYKSNIVINSKDYLRILHNNDILTFNDFEEAVIYYENAAEQGDITAQLNLGIMHQKGWHYQCNLEESAKWFNKALNSIDKDKNKTPSYLGEIMSDLAQDFAFENNYEQSLFFYTLAAEQGYSIAQYALGSIYYNGDCGITRDRKKAIKYLKMAAEQGHKYAIELLKDDKNLLYRFLNPIVNDHYNRNRNF